MADFTMRELFEAMPQYAKPSAIEGVNKTIQWEFSGEDGGNYYIVVQDGKVESHEGVASHADATIISPADVWKRVATGQENGAVAFMMGKFKATGDLGLLLAMQNWFSPPPQ